MNITYFLGAGASYNALPIVTEMNDRLIHFMHVINDTANTWKHNGDRRIVPDLLTPAEQLIKDIRWLVEEARRHQTIDTLAKKLFILNERHNDLKTLKQVLTVYFLYEQFAKGAIRKSENNLPVFKEIPDKRYDSFIASIITNNGNRLALPGNIKIITWNYDLQLEIAFKEYFSQQNISTIQDYLQIIPSRKFLLEDYKLDFEKFMLVRLNGVAGIGKYQNTDILDSSPASTSSFLDEVIEYTEPIQHLIDYYRNLVLDSHQNPISDLKLFNFSWEDDSSFKENVHEQFTNLRDVSKKIMTETDVLVIIGYSFPFFNKKVDTDLFSALRNLDKIYIQDINKDIVEKFKGLYPNFFDKQKYTLDFVYQPNVNQFVLPDELI